MILSVTFSKPTKECEKSLGKAYIRVRIWRDKKAAVDENNLVYNAEFLTDKQSFRKTMTLDEVESFKKENTGITFKCTLERTDTEEITSLSNRHGETTVLRKPLQANSAKVTAVKSDEKCCCSKEDNSCATSNNANSDISSSEENEGSQNRVKNYILKEGTPVPFLVKLGVMSKDGKVIAQKYDKFRQINRFLEFIDDVIPDVTKLVAEEKKSTAEKDAAVFTEERPLRIADFGCGKSYLTFAVYYYLTVLKNIPVEITGLDLKKDVIEECDSLAKQFGYTNLHFFVGNIADFNYKNECDIIITLHACDTATDLALGYAIKHNTKAILSVPCCQHEINLQLEKNKSAVTNDNPYASLLRYGLIRERFASLATDSLRAEILEQSGYTVQVLEFIDMEHTPKNILIRAVKKILSNEKVTSEQKKISDLSKERCGNLMKSLGCTQTLSEMISK